MRSIFDFMNQGAFNLQRLDLRNNSLGLEGAHAVIQFIKNVRTIGVHIGACLCILTCSERSVPACTLS